MVCVPLVLSGSGCNPSPPVARPEWRVVLSDLPAGLLSVSGTSAADVYAVGADPGDGAGPYVLHYDGEGWARRLTAVVGSDLWWISDRIIDGSFYMVGEHGLILRYQPATGTFDAQAPLEDVTLFGVWGLRSDFIMAVGGNINEPDTSGVIWRFDGTGWTTVDVTTINAEGIPVLFKVWGRSDDEVYAVGAGGVILRFDGEEWRQLPSPTSRSLFTVHGNDQIVVACGGAQSGVVVEAEGGPFADVTPAGMLQMNGAFVPPNGEGVLVGRESAVAFREGQTWVVTETGLDVDRTLDYHAAWVDPDGGVWAVGGNIVGNPRFDGLLAYSGTRPVGTTLVAE